MNICEETLSEKTTNLSYLPHMPSKKDITSRPFYYEYPGNGAKMADISPEGQKLVNQLGLYLDKVYFYPPTRNGKDPVPGDNYTGTFNDPKTNIKSAQVAASEFNREITQLRRLLKNPIVIQLNKQGNNSAFMIAHFEPQNPTDQHVILAKWVKRINNASSSSEYGNSWNHSPTNGGNQTGIYNDSERSQSERLPLKPSQVMADHLGKEMSASEVFTAIKNSEAVKKYVGIDNIDSFQKLTSFPWTLGEDSVNRDGTLWAITKYFCEILHPLSLIKTPSITINGLDDFKRVSDRAFGSPTAYLKSSIVYPSSGSEGLLDSKLVLGNKEIWISSKKMGGSGTNPKTVGKILEDDPELSRIMKRKYPDAFRVFHLMYSQTRSEALADLASDPMIGILSSDEAEAAKKFYLSTESDKNTRQSVEQLQKSSPRLFDVIKTADTKKVDDIGTYLFDSIRRGVTKKVNSIPELSEMIFEVLNTVNFVKIDTSGTDKVIEGKPILLTFQIQVPEPDKLKITFDASRYEPRKHGTTVFLVNFGKPSKRVSEEVQDIIRLSGK